jgi:hypothetical protein
VPVVDSADRVRLIISAYQQSKDKFHFKMIAKDMQQPGLPESSNDNKVFTRQSLAGIFNSLEKQVIALKNIPNSPSSNIETTRGLGISVSGVCWSIFWVDENGGVFVTNWQCSYTIRVTQSAYGWISSNVPDLPEIGGGGGGGGGNDYQNIRSTIINSVNTDDNIISREIIESTNRRRVLTYVQKIIEGGFPFGWWRYDSEDKVISIYNETKKVWEIESIEHLSVRKQGFQVNLQTNLIMNNVNTIIAPNKKTASMELKFDVEYNYDGLGITTFHGIEAYLKVLSFNAEL